MKMVFHILIRKVIYKDNLHSNHNQHYQTLLGQTLCNFVSNLQTCTIEDQRPNCQPLTFFAVIVIHHLYTFVSIMFKYCVDCVLNFEASEIAINSGYLFTA